MACEILLWSMLSHQAASQWSQEEAGRHRDHTIRLTAAELVLILLKAQLPVILEAEIPLR